MKKVFITSDTHFNHANIIKYCDRPFSTTEEMNKALIANWNRVVGPEDTVFHLGDVALAKGHSMLNEFIKPLNGKKILIRGNHDKKSDEDFIKAGFEKVSYWPIVYDNYFILSHQPMFVTDKLPYANIYGHVHNRPEYKDYTANTFCACVERWGYAPVDFEFIKQKMQEAADAITK